MANVNVINKNNTDYYFEDTAGRNLTATKQDDSLVAVKAYAIGDFFWYNDKLYKVKSAVASGATIVLATDADETTVGAELKLKVNDTPTFSQASTRENLTGSGETFATILGKIKKWFADLKALAFIDTASTDPTTKYLRGDGQWITFPQGGHTMLPTPNANVDEDDVVSAINTGLLEGGANDDVASLYGVGVWSNVKEVAYCVQGAAVDSPIGTNGIGDWEDETDHDGWMEIAELYGIGSTECEVKLVYDPKLFTGPIPVLGGWKIEDAATISDGHGGTMNGGLLCIKFANEISSADTATAVVGVKIITDRTVVSYVSVHSAT